MRLAGILFLSLLATARERDGALVQQAPAQALRQTNPLRGNTEAGRAGAKLFAQECAACHGVRSRGSEKAPPLNRGDIRQAPPGALFWVLRNGSLHRGMPSFAHLPELERWQIVTFLQEVAEPKADSHGRP
ncbi:MAG TPA: c-type cytochrome [Bryobacteraceae bacterium]